MTLTMQNKIPPLLLSMILAALMVPLSWLPPSLGLSLGTRLMLGAAPIIAGAGFVLLGVAKFRANHTTVNPLKPETATTLVTTGIYAISRNPMYLGFFLLLLGWSLILASGYGIVLSVAFAGYLDRFQIRPEEEAMATLFGDQFDKYKARVGRWI